MKYKKTWAAKGSKLYESLSDSKAAQKIYEQTTKDFDALYGKEARLWFESMEAQWTSIKM